MSRQSGLYACVYVREFPAQVTMRLRPELRERPVVVLEGERPLESVCALNLRARQIGVERRMTRVEVETFEGVAVLQRSKVEEEAARAVLLECAGTFSPRVEVWAGESAAVCVIDIAGMEKLYGPPLSLARTLLKRVRGLGMAASVAVSNNFDAAVCQARGMQGQPMVIPEGAEDAALAALPLDVLDMSKEHAEIFAMWGIRTLGELGSLPEEELIARLGQAGKRLRQRARGELPHLFMPVEPVFRLEERMELEAALEAWEPLLFVMRVMLEQLILRATARVLALAEVTVSLELEGSAPHVRRIRPALPSNECAMWLKLIQMDLETHPPEAAVTGMVLTAEPGATSKVQMGLFSPQLPEPMKLDITLARIKAIVGEECVGSPVLKDTHRPDGFSVAPFIAPGSQDRPRGAQLRAVSGARARQRTDEVGGGPAAMRQIRPAERLCMTMRGEQPAAFGFRNLRYEVERAYGPWVTSGEWWSPALWQMEHWDLIARGGDDGMLCCCVALDGMDQVWKMVGLYD